MVFHSSLTIHSQFMLAKWLRKHGLLSISRIEMCNVKIALVKVHRVVCIGRSCIFILSHTSTIMVHMHMHTRKCSKVKIPSKPYRFIEFGTRLSVCFWFFCFCVDCFPFITIRNVFKTVNKNRNVGKWYGAVQCSASKHNVNEIFSYFNGTVSFVHHKIAVIVLLDCNKKH